MRETKHQRISTRKSEYPKFIALALLLCAGIAFLAWVGG